MEDESPKGLLQRAWGGLQGIWLWLLRILVAVFFAWIFFWITGMASDEYAHTDLEGDIDAIREEEADAPISQKDLEMWSFLMYTVNRLEHGDFHLDGDKAKEFGNAYFPENAAIYVKEVHFDHERKTAQITYDQSINKEITLKCENRMITKTLIRYEGFSEGESFFRYVKWFTYGRFMKGYPQYVCKGNMLDGYMNSLNSANKYIIRLKPFSKVSRFFSLFRSAVGGG